MINRRKFIGAAASMAIPFTMDGMGIKALTEEHSLVRSLKKSNLVNEDRILVIINMLGGNDGLNTVIPKDQYSAYNGLRSNIAIPENTILSLNGVPETGLHPAMTGLQTLFNEGKLSIIHSVSYPDPNQSHFRSADIWMTGVDANQYSNSGWMGRYLMDRYTGYPVGYPNTIMDDPIALQIGYLATPTLQGQGQSMAITIDSPDNFYQLIGSSEAPPPSNLPPYTMGEQIQYIRTQQTLAVGYANEIKKAADMGTNIASYPPDTEENDLARQLKIVARLINGGLKTKIFFVSQFGYDTHAAQVDTLNKTQGEHATLLRDLSKAIFSFQRDIEAMGLANRVMGMTFSEFGRRADSNNSRGTDHGIAAPMFMFGHGIKKQIIGTNPNLTTGLIPAMPQPWETYRDIKMQIDFRRVYADVLNDWFGATIDTTDQILFRNFKTTSIFKDTIETVDTGNWNDAEKWSSGRPPKTNEHVVVNQGHTLTVNSNKTVKKVDNAGNIQLQGSAQLSITN